MIAAARCHVRTRPGSGRARQLVLVVALAFACRARGPAELPGPDASAEPPRRPVASDAAAPEREAGAPAAGADAAPRPSSAPAVVPARASLDAPVLDCVLPPRPLQSAQPGTASRVEHDVAYGPDPAQRFDVALPAPAAQGPAPPWVVLVHGGGWTAGDKRLYWPQLAILSSLGYAAATVNYRLARDPSRAFPVPPSDVACALAAIARESPRLGADGDRMVLVGGSSGGHLVALVAVAQNDPAVLGVCADRFPTPAGVVAFYPPLELRGTAARYPERLNMAVEELFRLPPGTAAWQRATTLATPVAQLPPPGSAANLGLPPFLLIAAGSDVIVPADDTRVFHQSLRDRGVPSLLVEVPGAGHGFPILGRGASQRPATCTLLEFLRRALGPR